MMVRQLFPFPTNNVLFGLTSFRFELQEVNHNLVIGYGDHSNLIILKIVGNTIVDNSLVSLTGFSPLTGLPSALIYNTASKSAFMMKQTATATGVFKFPLADCSSKLSCTACNSDYCGWCFPTGTCVSVGSCPYTNLFYVNATCPGNDLASATPNPVDKSESNSIAVTLQNPRFVDPSKTPPSFSFFLFTCFNIQPTNQSTKK